MLINSVPKVPLFCSSCALNYLSLLTEIILRSKSAGGIYNNLKRKGEDPVSPKISNFDTVDEV